MKYKGKPVPFRETPYLLWIVLSLPILPMIYQVITSDLSPRTSLRPLISPSGQYGAWLILLALMTTPLSMLFRGKAIPRWLVRNRRYIGVAGFSYAAIHTLFYLGWRGKNMIADVFSISHGSGWVLLLVLIPVAITSTDAWVRRLGPRWKTLQKLVYIGAFLTLLHWVSLHNGRLIPIATASFAPFAALLIYRIARTRNRQRV